MLLLAFKNKSFNVQLVRKLLAYHYMFKSFCHGINFGSHLWQINCLYLTFEVLVNKNLVSGGGNVILQVVACGRYTFNFCHILQRTFVFV